MKMQLMTLTIDNFKCFAHTVIRFNGRNAAVYGQNGSGKSSVYDAFLWLLFGKDSRGRKDFDIKPHNPDGSIKDHAAITSVEAALLVDGAARTLRRTYYEVWSTRRGSANTVFDGHSSDYFVDGVPCKKGEFESRVAAIIPEDRFRLLTNTAYFASVLPWKERRAALFTLADVTPDEDLLAAEPQFAPLLAALDGLPVEDCRRKLEAWRKTLSGLRGDIPARLDECKKTVEDLSSMDFSALEEEKKLAAEKQAAVQRDLRQLEQDGGRLDLQNRLMSAEIDLARLENENTAFRNRQLAEAGPDEIPGLRRQLEAVRNQNARYARETADLKGKQAVLEREISLCRERWNAVDSEEFQEGTCRACGQTLPPDRLAEAKAAFEQDKSSRKSKAVREADQAKMQLADTKDHLSTLEWKARENEEEITNLSRKLQELEAAPKPEIHDLDGFADQKAELQNRAELLRRELQSLDLGTSERQKCLRERLAEADRELERVSGELAKRTALNYARRRMDELRGEARKAAEELNQVDNLLFLCGEFTRRKAHFVEESVNRNFSLARFRLFRELVNGGVEECCDVTVGGSGYDSGLNDGAKVQAGLDIIRTLSRRYGVQVPLFVDNAESVTGPLAADAQLIRLTAAENEKELRFMYES